MMSMTWPGKARCVVAVRLLHSCNLVCLEFGREPVFIGPLKFPIVLVGL